MQWEWLLSKFNNCSKGRILAISQVQELIFSSVFLINVLKSLLSMEKSIASEKIDGFSLVNFESIFDNHDEFEDSECFED